MHYRGSWIYFFLAGLLLPFSAGGADNPFPYAAAPVPSLEKLADGFVEGDRVKSRGNQLSMAVETFYLVPQSPSESLEQIKNPHQYSTGESSDNFGIDGRGKITLPPQASAFRIFDLISKKSRFGFGGSPMLELQEDNLNLSREDLGKLQSAAKQGREALESGWVDLFVARTRAFQESGIVGITPYQTGSSDFHHQAELVNFLKSTPEVLQEFQGLLGSLMTGNWDAVEGDPVFTWESSKVQGDQTVSLACLVSQSSGRGGYKVAEVSYYVTGKYYTALILYDLEPVQFNGREHTLVWRGDYVITSSIGFLKGIERVAAENIMLQEVKNSVRSFIDSARGQ